MPAETRAAASSRALPSGMVTFVFTDIEGSTKILKRLPDQAPELFERHNDIVRAALDGSAGHEVGTDGDAFFIAFENADAALTTCAEIQTALAAEDWPEAGTIRVRMGIHTGPAAPRGDNYVALAIHQAARVVSAAHGGQIVVSETALRHTHRAAPGDLVSLGAFRVRDFDEPELLHRLDPPGIPVVDRPLRAMPAGGHNLVSPPTSFLGREREMREIADMLEPRRILTLVGPGGTGKTRLATEAALTVADGWHDGVWLVSLADLDDSSLVPSAIADAIGLAPSATDRWPDVMAWARDKRSLLVIDNVENHAETCARLLPELIQHPHIAVMTTSREPLSVAGEHQYRVGPLDVPTAGADESAIRGSPAVELFVDRATARRADFRLDDRSAVDVAQLCASLDGLPLAIEIAAARLAVMSVQEILAGLHDRFGLLKSPDRTLPPRHRTMANLLAWSYDLLEPAEQIAFRRLGVFAGTFTVAAAVAALADDTLPADDVPELVWSLVDKSLVVADLTESGTRYRLLETVEQFAEGILVEHGEDLATGRRAASTLLDLVGPRLKPDRGWVGELAVELPNVRSLIARLTPHEQETAQQLVCSLARYHQSANSFRSGIEEVTRAARVLDARTPTRVVLLTALADLHLRCAETSRATELLDEAQLLADDVGAPDWSDAALDRTRGEILLREGRHEAAIHLAEQALTRGLSLHGQARMQNLAGIARYEAGHLAAAMEPLSSELEIYEQLGFEANMASAHGNLAELAMHLDEFALAAMHQQASLDLALEIGQPVMIAFSAIVAARLAASDGDWELAVRLQSSAGSELAAASHTMYAADQAEFDALWSQATEQLGEDVVAAHSMLGAELGTVATASLASGVFTAVRAAPGHPSNRPDPPSEGNPS